MLPDKTYVYVFVRTDIPLADQIVQVGHACLEAGQAFYRPNLGTAIQADGQLGHQRDVANLVLIGVRDHDSLLDAAMRCGEAGACYEMFFEPDDNMGWTAFATEPISGKIREAFKDYKLWKP